MCPNADVINLSGVIAYIFFYADKPLYYTLNIPLPLLYDFIILFSRSNINTFLFTLFAFVDVFYWIATFSNTGSIYPDSNLPL